MDDVLTLNTKQITRDESWMSKVLNLAQHVESAGEVPVGALLVLNNECVAEGWNQPITNNDPSAHAEIIALRAAGQVLNNYRLVDSTLYVTLEPCVMCAGAIINARVARVVFGAYDPKAGAAGSVFDVLSSNRLNHSPEVYGGVLESQCADQLQSFFKDKR